VLLTPHYAPESGAAAHRLTAIARGFAARGWAVRVVTALPHHPQNAVYDGYDVRAPWVRNEDGVEVVRLRPWLVPRSNLALRLLVELVFCLRALPHAVAWRPDAVLASSPYLFFGPVGWLAARLARAAFVWDVRDLTWLYAAAAGRRTYGLDRVLDAWMRATAAGSTALVTATEGLMAYFQRRPQHSLVMPNGVTHERIAALGDLPPAPVEARRVLYAGLFGYNHGLGTVVDAAARLPDVAFVFAGDGPERGSLEERARAAGCQNVAFTGYLEPDALREAYANASLLVSHVRGGAVNRWTQPAKVWEYMATRRPVVHAGEGEVLELLAGRDVARFAPPDDPGALADAIAATLADPDAARRMGERGAAYVATHRDRARLVDDLVAFVEALRSA
jgi:glycosyltransferase involved in cell wall biosynthesis